MDESWWMRMGMDASFPLAARKSMDEYTSRRSSDTMDVEDFTDVFGGPPRSILTLKFSGDFTRSHSFYDEIFLPSEFASRALPQLSKSQGRSLPAFRIPTGGDEFYGDVFRLVGECGSGGGRRSREGSRTNSKCKSKSNSSSVLSSEGVSPLCSNAAAAGDDEALSSFASKLRPINVPSRYTTGRPQSNKQGMPAFMHGNMENTDVYYNYYYGNSNVGGVSPSQVTFSRRAWSPGTISLEPKSFRSMNLGPSSPASSPVSSVCQEPRIGGHGMEEEIGQEVQDDVMSSYVIEINSDNNNNNRDGGSDAIDIDEAIAWAKERFQRNDDREKRIETECDQGGEVSTQGSIGYGTIKSQKSEEQMEMELLDEDIRLWSTGKETNIRLLLSTLHHILWPNSGWCAIPLANLKEGSQVKKAYQKARLCLHPDKLQQRGGADFPQKYVAEKAFSILQDAWAAYISQEGFLT